jgi:hypothetical protein
MLCRWIQGDRGGKLTPGISEYNNFVDDKKVQHNYFCLYSIDKLLYELDVLLELCGSLAYYQFTTPHLFYFIPLKAFSWLF